MNFKEKIVNYTYTPDELKKIKIKNFSDSEYMNSLSGAILTLKHTKLRILLWSVVISIVSLIVWAYYAKIDTLTRGNGRVIPSNKVQTIQNLEGGIVSDILVKEGQHVDKGDILIKIDDTSFASTYVESKLRYDELRAKSIRLLAEAGESSFSLTKSLKRDLGKLIVHEYSLYLTNKEQLKNNIVIFQQQLKQKESELQEVALKIKNLQNNYKLLEKEVELNEPLFKKHLVAEVDFLKLKRELATKKGEIEELQLSIPRLKSKIQEQKSKIRELKLSFANKAKEKYNEVQAQMQRIQKSNIAKEDKVRRTDVRSPVDGTIKQLLVNTIGGVVKPGMDLVKIVPSQDGLVIETKIRPSDIAFLHVGQRAIVKFSAYDFAVYGSLGGTLIRISADTIEDKADRKNYYLVYIKTDRNYLEKKGHKLQVIVGMTADVDIITGKKSVLDFILKPLLRASQNVVSER